MLVTASRTPVDARQVGSSITVIDSQEIEARQAVFVTDLLRSVPGVSVSQSGGIGSFTQLRIRGAEANQTLVLIDGIEVNDPGIGSEFNFADLLAADVERIEVIRGPQSSLWGSDAVGGVINIITKKADGPLRVEGFVDGGSFGSIKAGGAISQRWDMFDFSLRGQQYETDGTNAAERGGEEDGYRNGTVNLNIGLSPLENLNFSIVGRHTEAEREFDPADAPSFKPSDGDNETDVSETYGLLQADLDLFEGAWQHKVGAAITSTDSDNFESRAETTSTQGKRFKLNYQTSIMVDAPKLADSNHTLTFALEREQEEFKQSGEVTDFGNPNQKQNLTHYSYITEYRMGLLQRLYLGGAIRHDDNEEFDDATTYRGMLSYVHPESNTKLWGAYGTGVKNPTFTERFGFTPDTFFGNPDLRPERSKGWEIGIAQPFLGDRASLSLSYFNDRLEDDINGFFFDPALGEFGGFTAVNVSGESERQGVEFTLRTRVFEHLNITSTYSWTDSKQPDADGRQTREIRRPEHQASLILDYRFLEDKANIHLGVDYVGEQRDSDFSTFPAGSVTLDDYTLVSLAASYQVLPALELFTRVENLLDEEYQDVFGFETPGIAGFAGARVKFNL